MHGQINDKGIERVRGRRGRIGNVRRFRYGARRCGGILPGCFLVGAICLATASTVAQSEFPPIQGTATNHSIHQMLTTDPNVAVNSDAPQFTREQRQRIMRSNFETSKNDAAELAALAKGVREELSTANANVLSPGLASRIERIQKLARKIREETKGF